MQDSFSIENDFINKITEIIEENISNEQFGVSELADQIGMSRSNLLRKVKTLTKLSVSQFIRQIRLKHAMEILRQSSLTVSEVSYKVGFSSTSYFIKCFGDYFGYSPGEVGKREIKEDPVNSENQKKGNRLLVIVSSLILIILLAVITIIYKPWARDKNQIEKSIAVLPFKNDSNDSTNVYFINGLMESILNNLQKIEDLKVISRTSVEKYRINSKTIPEIAQELNVSYFVEGSGQKIGDKILLNIQLIEASTDKHLWAEQYKREIEDIFNLQMEIAKSIADEIEVIITPEEQERINKIPTDNLEAYDYFLKGLDLFHNSKNFEEAIVYFKKAIELDNEFARAYADIAMSYFYIDIFRTEKKYTAELNSYADKAILLDPKLAHGLIAKALSFMMSGDLNTAVSYLEKALEYNPNSSLVINFLSDFYTRSEPNTAKYLEYALKGMALDPASLDSSESSLNYLHLGNAFIQSGFIDEAEEFINKSLEYDPTNLYSEQVRAYILYAKNKDYTETKNILVEALRKDTTRIDIVQEIGKIYYYMRDYEKSFAYYKPFIDARETYNLDIYVFENAKIGKVLYKLGMFEESEKLFASYKNYAENDYSIYKNVSLSMYYSHIGDTQKALEHLRLFSQESNYQYWLVLFLRDDPLVENIKYLPEFEEIMTIIEEKFWKNHKKIRASLEKKNLL